jgi:hypothetical protein
MKKLAYTCLLVCACLSTASALTKKERALVTVIQSEVREGINDLSQSHTELANAQKQILDTQHYAFETDKAIGVVKAKAAEEHKNLVAFAKLNAKMKPVYDQVTKWCGFGAIVYGLGRIVHCLMWLVIGIVILVVVVIGLSVASPAFGAAVSIILTMLRIPVGLFHAMLIRIETWLQSRKSAPVPIPIPAPPIASSTS